MAIYQFVYLEGEINGTLDLETLKKEHESMLPVTIEVPLQAFDACECVRVYRLNRLMNLC